MNIFVQSSIDPNCC